MKTKRDEQLAELSVRLTNLNKSIHLKECDLNSLRYQYEQVAEQFCHVFELGPAEAEEIPATN